MAEKTHRSYREESKKDYGKQIWPEDSMTNDDLKTGCMQRIADATELMAKNHQQLITDRDYYKRRYTEQSECSNRLFKRVSALKGVITRQKKLIKEYQEVLQKVPRKPYS